MSEKLKISGNEFKRDSHTRALINTDNSAYEAILVKRQLSAKRDSEVTELRHDVNELKDLVHKLIEKMEDKNG